MTPFFEKVVLEDGLEEGVPSNAVLGVCGLDPINTLNFHSNGHGGWAGLQIRGP